MIRNYYKIPVFLLALAPFGYLLWGVFTRNLGANPVEYVTHETGAWALRFLLITLAASPLRRITGWAWPPRLRRMMGLFAFFYALLHFAIYVGLDLRLDFSHLGEDIAERPYITVGFTALVLLLPLAATSTNRMMRRLGKRWKKLHRLIYPIAILGVIHFLWLVKADIREPAIYGTILTVLLGERLWGACRKRGCAEALRLGGLRKSNASGQL